MTDAAQVYADRLEQNGVSVTTLHYPHTFHGFMSIRFFPERTDSLQQTVLFLDQAFGVKRG